MRGQREDICVLSGPSEGPTLSRPAGFAGAAGATKEDSEGAGYAIHDSLSSRGHVRLGHDR